MIFSTALKLKYSQTENNRKRSTFFFLSKVIRSALWLGNTANNTKIAKKTCTFSVFDGQVCFNSVRSKKKLHKTEKNIHFVAKQSSAAEQIKAFSV